MDIKKLIDDMTIDEKVGQMCVPILQKAVIDDDIKKCIKEYGDTAPIPNTTATVLPSENRIHISPQLRQRSFLIPRRQWRKFLYLSPLTKRAAYETTLTAQAHLHTAGICHSVRQMIPI